MTASATDSAAAPMPLRHLPLLGVLFVCSGAAALVCQVLWVRELGLLFGSTAQAAALTIAIFFAGIALGAGCSGGWRVRWRRSAGSRSGWADRAGAFLVADVYFALWRAGVGNVYAVEHYRLAARRLNPGGAYVQRIPLYQVSRAELDMIAATMAEVFPELTRWRGDLYSERSILALVGGWSPPPSTPPRWPARGAR